MRRRPGDERRKVVEWTSPGSDIGAPGFDRIADPPADV
jgi:hypothetical protein